MNDLFSGIPGPIGGLSNQRELAEACPREFFASDNPWSKAAISFAYRPWSDTSDKQWQWKTSDGVEKEKQKRCIRAIGTSFWLTYEEKCAVAGWMLSVMVSKVPA